MPPQRLLPRRGVGRRVVAGAAALAVAALAGCAGTAAPAATAPPPASHPVTPELARATFDSAWRRIANTYYDTTFHGLDWAGVRAELGPQADSAATIDELRVVIQTMLDRLGDSHMVVIPGEAVFGTSAGDDGAADAADEASEPAAADAGASAAPADAAPGWSGAELRLVGDAVLVARVAPGSPAALAGLRPGDEVAKVGRLEVAPRLARLAALDSTVRAEAELVLIGMLEGQLGGSAGDTVAVRRRLAAERTDSVAVVLAAAPGAVVRFGNLPPLVARVDTARLTDARGCVGYVRLSVFMPAAMAPLEQAVDRYADCTGIVLDLRGNPGGVGGLAMRLSNLFVDTTHVLGTFHTRSGEMRFVTTPRRVAAGGRRVEPFDGRLAVLIDEFSMSTSEIAASGLQEIGRARVFGTATPGKALPSGMIRLPSGDVLLHAYAEYRTPAGVRLEGVGVRPDEAVPLEAGWLRTGRDAVLDAAVRWIRQPAASTSLP